MSETEILARAMRALVLVCPGAKFWRQNNGSKGHVRFASINLVDIIGYQRDAKILAVECKAASGKLTEEQCAFLQDVRDSGGYAAVYAPLKEGGLEDFFRYPEDVPEKFLPRKMR